MTEWTDELEAALTRMWEIDGMTAIAIAYRLGMTKSAVTGKATRLGLSERKGPVCWSERERVIREVQANDGVAADAARILGVNVDAILKSSVRLGLRFPHRGGRGVLTGQRSPGAAKRPKRPPRAPDVTPAAPEPPEPYEPPVCHEGAIDDIMKLRDGITNLRGEFVPGTCRWPFGDEPPYTYCGANSTPGRPYCSKHNAMAFAPVPVRTNISASRR